MILDTRTLLPRLTITYAAQSTTDAEIHFRCEDGSAYAARLWFDAAWPHPNTAWTAEVVRGSPNRCISYMMHEQGCPRDNGARYITHELMRFLSVSVLPAFD